MPRPKLLPYKDGPKRYRVEIPKSLSSDKPRRRRRHFFPTLEQAEAFLRAFKAQQRDLGTSVRILRPAESIDAASAIRLLRRHAEKHAIRQPTLPDVAYAWIDQWHKEHRSVSLGKLFDQFLETRAGDSPKHQQSLGYTKERFNAYHQTKVAALTKTDVEDALFRLPPASYNAHLRRIRSVLTFGVKHGYASSNVALLAEPIKRPRQSVKVLPVETVELMLGTAQQSVPELIPFLCISLFTGTRPEEISRLRWDDLNLEDKVLRIRPEVSKTGRHRVVNRSDNFIEWIRSLGRESGRSGRVMAGFTRAILAIRRGRLCQLMREQQPTLAKHPPHNALRHLFVSMHIGKHNAISGLLLQSGHTNAVMFEHYLSIVSKADALRYWELRP